ncbi:hypothetical protein QTV43_000193 [Vibrio vulnificus]|nr:hypothetical protein [Vibrio vulnificus]
MKIDNQWEVEINQLCDGVTVEIFVITRNDCPIYQNDAHKLKDLELIRILEKSFNDKLVIPFLFKTSTFTHKDGISTVASIAKTYHRNIDEPVAGLSFFLNEISESQTQLTDDSDFSRVIVVVGEHPCEKIPALGEESLTIKKVILPSDVQLVALMTEIVASIRNICIDSHIESLNVKVKNEEILQLSIKVTDDEIQEYLINFNITHISKVYSRAALLEVSKMTAFQEISK